MTKRIWTGLLSIVLCVTLCGCSRRQAAEHEAAIVLPEPEQQEERMILGEQTEDEAIHVMLNYVSGDGTSFSTVARSVLKGAQSELYEEVLDMLLFSTSSPDGLSFIPGKLQVLSAVEASGIVTVNLSLDAHDIQNDQEYLMLMASITNTLLSIEGVRGVNVLIDGSSRNIAMLPVGIRTEPFEGITPTYAQLSAERDYFLVSETGTIVRNAALYFPAASGDCFVSEVRSIDFDSSNYASDLIRALRSGPMEHECAVSAIPESVDLLVNNPSMEITSSGKCIMRLDFASTLRSYLALSGIEEWKLIGSLALTLGSFVPDLDAIRIYIGDDPVTECTVGSNKYSFENALIRPDDFSTFIGDTVRLHVPNENSTLDAVERAVSRVRAQSPLSLSYALIDEALMRKNCENIFPTGVYHDDVLGISVENRIACLNLSANFYRQAQALDAAGERGVIYAFVNTLCELDSIQGVRFLIEGSAAETLSGSVYLKGVLLPNPGLLSKEQTAVPEITATP